jgi:hypothetical protein
VTRFMTTDFIAFRPSDCIVSSVSHKSRSCCVRKTLASRYLKLACVSARRSCPVAVPLSYKRKRHVRADCVRTLMSKNWIWIRDVLSGYRRSRSAKHVYRSMTEYVWSPRTFGNKDKGSMRQPCETRRDARPQYQKIRKTR